MNQFTELLDTWRPISVRRRIASAAGWFALGFLVASMFIRFNTQQQIKTQKIETVIEPVMAAERLRQHEAKIKREVRPIIVIRELPKQNGGTDK